MEATGLLTPVVQYLLQRLDEEARLVGGVKDEVNLLRQELIFISCYLDQPEGKRKEDAIWNVVIRKIREKAYEAEDIIDQYILIKTSKHRRRNALVKIFHGCCLPKDLADLAKAIITLKNEINNIFKFQKIYAIGSAETSVDADRREALHSRRREVEEDVVGFDNNFKALAKLFIENGSQLDVISIIGMGGLGKTTLAKKIYNMTHVSRLFARHAWVNVSQHDKTRELLLKNILQQMPRSDELRKNLKGMGEDELKKTLSEYLNGERYIVVMDGIWKTDSWNELKSAFPNNSNGSRILITSRNKDVALKARQLSPSSRTAPYVLPFLNKKESWELFRKKVFKGGECRPELKALGKQLAERCRGLPLSIVVLGGILANKSQELLSWKKFIQVNPHLTECKDILASSYAYLPQHLKPCFLYLGAYPEGFEIPVRQLINLWIAEGFIEHTPSKGAPEDVAEEYLEELIYRSLIQVASKRTDRSSIKTCRIHDLLRDLCITQGAKEKFIEVRKDRNQLCPSTSRRLSIQGSIDPYISSNPSHPTVVPRSLLFLGGDTNEFDKEHWTWVDKNFKLIRVLNFGHVINSPTSIPSCIGKLIGKLIHLRYLGINCDALNEVIISSIGKLTNLETLDMRGTFLNCLPKGIWKLRRLRNLYVTGAMSFLDDLHAKPLWRLEVLSTVSLTPDNVQIFKAKLPNLRKLGICFALDSHSHVLNSLSGLSHLQKLKIISYSERYAVPISFPFNITKITLQQGWLEGGGSMEVLGKLSGLMILKLESCSLPSNLEFIAGSFPQLEVLKLKNLKIKEWKLQERDAMPCLKHLVINKCRDLTVLALESLCALQDVEVLWSNVESVMTLQRLKLQKLQENLRFNLVIDPPDPNDNFYQRTAVSSATSS